MKIRLVDDNPIYGAALSSQLQAIGYECTYSSTALSESEIEDCSLVLMDLHFHSLNGFEQGSQMPQGQRKKLLLYSFHARSTDSAWAEAIGLGKVLAFPMPGKQLHEEIVQRVGLSEAVEI
ncbi:MAG: hypothetical protein R3332_06250 [Pseudohongiellaceae bacterium]|nr:hypothetical protein [Pseudohongiellaceae bacterium]